MKVAFLTEGRWSGKIHSSNPNLRTDLAWICALSAEHLPLYSYPKDYDLVIIIIPKKCEDGNFDISIWLDHFYKEIQPRNGKIAFLQEGPHQYWQDYRIETQIAYLQFLKEVDLIFCHNEYDKKYYQGLLPSKPCRTLPALMIEDAIPKTLVPPEHRVGTMIGGNWVSWYSGQDSYMIAQEFGEKIYAPSMGRKQASEELIDDINYIPYKNWSRWMIDLSKVKYAVHLMRTFAAGTFALNCAYLGTPCIGYKQLDTQRICFPELSVELGDLETARKIAMHLKKNHFFYTHVSNYAQKAYRDNFGQDVFTDKFNSIQF